MTKTRLHLLAISALLTLSGAVVSGNNENETTDPLREIANYRSWTRVTGKPILIADAAASG